MYISIDRGKTFYTAEEYFELPKEKRLSISWGIVPQYMDDDTREQVRGELLPCTEQEFLTRYLEIAPYDLILG